MASAEGQTESGLSVNAFEYGSKEDAKGPNFSSLYGALQAENRSTVQAAIAAEAERAKSESRKPNSVKLPTQYRLVVPEAPEDRAGLTAHLKALFTESFKSRKVKTRENGEKSVLQDGVKPAESARPFKSALYQEDLDVLVGIFDILPPPERADFPAALRARVDVTENLVRGGVIEAAAALVRYYAGCGADVEKTLGELKHLIRDVPASKGMAKVRDLKADDWAGVVGHRVIKLDDKTNEPEVTRANQALYEQVLAKFEGMTDLIEDIVGAYNEKIDPFVRATIRDPGFLRARFFQVMLNNLLKVFDADRGDAREALQKIAADLRAVRSPLNRA